MGELEVRGPSIASAYYESDEGGDRWTDDGWFKTGDVVTIHPDGFVEVQDRAKDLCKSGGEWISTVALENALMGHPAVAEAAVIAVPDDKWSERPLAVVVLRDGATATDEELREFIAPNFAKWCLPDHFEYVDEIPKTAVGKFRKTALREQFAPASEFAKSFRGELRSSGLSEFVSSERDGMVAVVTIDHAPVNALSAPLLEELEAELVALDGDDAVRAIVVKGAGERAFVAGADISEFPSLREAPPRTAGRRAGSEARRAMDASRTPLVAAIHGFCLGGGLELAMCCDIRVASDDAQLGQPEIKLGLIPGGGGTQRLPRLVGIGRALLLNLTGDFIDAATAYDWGLVEKVVPREELLRRRSASRGDRGPLARVPLRCCGSSRGRPRPASLERDSVRGRRLPPLPRERGWRRGCRRFPREARAPVHGPLSDHRRTARRMSTRATSYKLVTC
jgi:enoyl-CoA hydratase/carnithine racemase